MIFEKKKDNTVPVGIVSSAIGAFVGTVATIILSDKKKRQAVTNFFSQVMDTTTQKGQEVIDATTKAVEKNLDVKKLKQLDKTKEDK